MLKLRDDPDWAVRRQLAASLGALPAASRETAIAALLERHGDDPVMVDAALSGVRGSETGAARRHCSTASRGDAAASAAITMAAATIVRGGAGWPVQEVFALVAQTDAARAGSASAMMRGAEAALLGAPMPAVEAAAVDAARRGRGARRGRTGAGGRARRSRRRAGVPATRPRRPRNEGGGDRAVPLSPRARARRAGRARDAASSASARRRCSRASTWPGKPDAAPAARR